MTARRIVAVSAGLGQPSSTRLLADRLADAAAGVLREAGTDVRVDVVELRDLAHDLTDNLMTGFANQPLRQALQLVEQADGVVAVTPIFSGSYNGLFKTFFDVLPQGALAGTPVLLAATAGTARHSLALDHALRPLFAYLRALVVPTGVFAASEDWGAAGDGALGERIARAGVELAELVTAHPRVAAPDPFDTVTPFADLLGA